MSLTPCAQDIDNASTKGLQELTAKMTGKPCTNRNAKAMRARLHAMIISARVADKEAVKEVERETEGKIEEPAGKPASPFGEGPSEPQTGKPAKVAPAKKEKPAKAAPKKKEKVAKPEAEKPAAPAKERAARAEKALAEKPAPAKKEKPAKAAPKKKEKVAKPAKKERADKPARAPRAPNPARLHTKSTLADLPVDAILVHNFRGGESVRVRVAEVPAKDGSGGVFFYKNKKYIGLKGLRAIVLETSGVAWNVLMYFRREDTGELLQPYPQHAKKEPAAA